MLEKLTQMLRDYTGNENIVIDEETELQADLGLNSLDLVSMACEVEDEFEVEIPDRAIKDFKTIGDVIAFIEE